jgi:tetratricopeptide (TPR) repeat protein
MDPRLPGDIADSERMTILGWWRDWREQRAVLGELRDRQRTEEANLLDQNLNPFNLAKMTLDSGNPVNAALHWERARALLPGTVLKSPESLGILLGLKRYEEAEELMRQRQTLFPRDHSSLMGLARVAEERGDMEEALKRWELARSKVVGTLDAWLGCGRCLEVLGRLDEAQEQFDYVVRRTPDEMHGWLGCARISDRREDWKHSLELWKHMAEDLRFPTAFAFVAKTLARLGRADEAEAYLQAPSLLYPADIEIALTLGRLARARGDLSIACEQLQRVRANNSGFRNAYREGAIWLAEAERHDEADAVLRRAIELFPNEAWPMLDFARLAHDRRDWTEAAARWAALRQRFPAEEMGYSSGAEALRAAGREQEAADLRPGAGD